MSKRFLDKLAEEKTPEQSGQGQSVTKTAILQNMLPPAIRPGLPLQGKKSSTLQKQAQMHAATLAHPGPLGTVPDDDVLEAATESSAAVSGANEDLVPRSWQDYFDAEVDLDLSERQGTFRVYTAGTAGPVVYCLHGGGYSGLTWALLAKQLKGRYRLAAIDQRGHGKTVTNRDDDLSADTLVADAVAVWQAMYSGERPPIVLVGHSMGGAIAVRTAATKEVANLQGMVVIDVVEGTAMSSLPYMMTVLRQRPQSFPSPQHAISWARKSGMSKNTEAACISLPSCLVEQAETSRGAEASTGSSHWVWRTPLAPSQPFWEGWYRGLSDLFMSIVTPKVLVLAGTDRLDRSLTVGQMQGKFQLVLLPQAGHAVHEDQHERTAEVIASFIQRFRIGLPKMQIPTAGAGATRVLPVAAGPAYPS